MLRTCTVCSVCIGIGLPGGSLGDSPATTRCACTPWHEQNLSLAEGRFKLT